MRKIQERLTMMKCSNISDSLDGFNEKYFSGCLLYQRLLASLLLCSLLQVRKANFSEFKYKSCVLGFEPKYRCPLEQCESPNSSYFTNGELPSFYGSANYSDINDRCKIPEIIG